MSFAITTAFVQQYKTTVALLLQQKNSRFSPAVMQDTFVGKAASMLEQFGSVTPARNLPRHADTPLIATPEDRRWVYPNDYEWADLIDQPDRLRMLIDPTSPYAMAGVAALNRAKDDEIIAAFYNSAFTGADGTNSTGLLSAFNSGSQVIAANVGASANTGMNIAKLRAAKQRLMLTEVDVDNDELYVAISARQHDNLLGETQAVSLDYNDRPVLVDGRIKSFMGFNFILSERIAGAANFNTNINSAVTGYTTGSQWLCPVWAKSGMKLGIWNEVETRIDVRPDKRFSTQVYVKGTFGASRTEEFRTVLITCV